MVVPVVGIEGTLTQRTALVLFQLSIQNGIAVSPSDAVKRMSAPFAAAFVKSKFEPSCTFTWKLESVDPFEFVIVTALRYCQEGENQFPEAGAIVRLAVLDDPRLEAMILAVVLAETVVVVTVKVALVAPAAIATVAGTDAALLSLDRFTTVPPLGAAPLSVTVPCVVFPPKILFWLKESDASTGSTVIDAVWVLPM